jgi:preprotein translocase subunit SecE
MNDSFYIKLLVWTVVLGTTFGILWRKGYLARLGAYTAETREELKKCTWPTWDELKGNTAVVSVSIVLLGVFTVAVDFLIMLLVKALTQ